MSQLTKKKQQDKRRKDLNAFVSFIKPVHKTLAEPINLTSLAGAAKSFARNKFAKNIEATTQIKGIVLTQALLYEKLLMADIQLTDL